MLAHEKLCATAKIVRIYLPIISKTCYKDRSCSIPKEEKMTTETTQRRIPLGRTVITPNALDHVHRADVCAALRRHTCGDWGDLSADDKAENELSLKQGFRLLSAYCDRNGTRFWIITEADRSSTTVLLPEDY
jgi:hypothetical protein